MQNLLYFLDREQYIKILETIDLNKISATFMLNHYAISDFPDKMTYLLKKYLSGPREDRKVSERLVYIPPSVIDRLSQRERMILIERAVDMIDEKVARFCFDSEGVDKLNKAIAVYTLKNGAPEKYHELFSKLHRESLYRTDNISN